MSAPSSKTTPSNIHIVIVSRLFRVHNRSQHCHNREKDTTILSLPYAIDIHNAIRPYFPVSRRILFPCLSAGILRVLLPVLVPRLPRQQQLPRGQVSRRERRKPHQRHRSAGLSGEHRGCVASAEAVSICPPAPVSTPQALGLDDQA